MKIREDAVAVKVLPETGNEKQSHNFLAELEICMNAERPSVLLDCSRVRQMDRSAILLLLSCLEAAMKRNGDVKLTGVSGSARETLRITGVDRLFPCLDANAYGLGTFQTLPIGAASNSAPAVRFCPDSVIAR